MNNNYMKIEHGFKLVNHSLVIVCMLFIIAIAVFTVPDESPISIASGTTLYVGGGGFGNYTTIQDAINASKPGDTIYVYSGVYYESIHINKTLNLVGENTGTTVINGSGTGDVIYIDNVDYVNITGFTIEYGESGIYLDHSSFINIYKNRVQENFGSISGVGIDIFSSSFINVQGNEIYNNGGNGIASWFSSYNNFINNTIHDNPECGLYFGGNPYYNNKIMGNIVYNIQDGINLDAGNPGLGPSNNWVVNNTVYNYGGCGIFMLRGNNNYVIGNTVYNITTVPINPVGGIALWATNNTSVIGNIIHNGIYGIELRTAAWTPTVNNSIKNNTVYHNENGIRLEGAIGNALIENTIFNNSYNVYMFFDIGGYSPSKGNNFIGCSLSNATTNVYLTEQSNNNSYINCTLSSASIDDFYLTDDSHATALNTSFNKSKVTYGDQLSNLTVKWYMHVKVVSSWGKPVVGANVTVVNETHDVVADRTTGLDGRAKWLVCTEYVQNKTGKVFHTPHNVTATKYGTLGYAVPEPFMNTSKEVVIVLVIVLPDYVPWNASPSQQKVSVGTTVLISSQVKNVGNGNATIGSTSAMFNQSTPLSPFGTHTVPPLNASEISNDYNATWLAPTTAGIYYVVIKTDCDNDIEEIDEDNNTYVIEFNVTAKPETTINIDTPQYGGLPLYVNTSTLFGFSVIDHSGTGYNTYYYVDAPPFILYTGPFTVPTEGDHVIYFNSTDNIGGGEILKTVRLGWIIRLPIRSSRLRFRSTVPHRHMSTRQLCSI